MIACKACNGTGRVGLPRAYAATLAVLSKDWITTREIRRALPNVKATAIANRLVWLESNAFAVSRGHAHNGRMHEWKTTPAGDRANELASVAVAFGGDS